MLAVFVRHGGTMPKRMGIELEFVGARKESLVKIVGTLP
jgi:hypothetical protein